MASVINQGGGITMSSSVSSQAGCAPVACADCGGPECLCRPRFFAGQLLTDEDLKRLDHYITEKNKLHNRYLIGWGVVCGLEVVCNVCDSGQVTLKSGYALSPCGEDIVVCSDVAVPICSMIQQCRRKQPQDCQPSQPGGKDPCEDTTEEWVLSIHYDEKSSRGVVPLKNTGGAACCSKCACGGSGGCGCRGQSSGKGSGCSCGSSSTSGGSGYGSCGCASQTAAGATSSRLQCEPTVTCETYRFEVCKIQPSVQPKAHIGAILQRFLNCFTALKELVAPPPPNPTPDQIHSWCCAIRNNLLDFFAANPGYSCSIPQKLGVMCQEGADVQTVLDQVGNILAQYLQDCFCSVFLPPCPCPVGDASVPLATITVSKKGGVCRVVRVCNLDVRKFATTAPNITYWLSVLPIVWDIRKALSAACCKPLESKPTKYGTPLSQAAFAAAAPATAAREANAANTVNTMGPFKETQEFSDLATQTFANRNRTVDVQTLARATLGLTDEKNQPFMSSLEMKHPLETLLLNQFALPLVESLLPAGMATILGAAATMVQPVTAAAREAAPVADIQSEIDALKARMQQMQDELDKSSKRKK